jgi:hypothetical protein
MGRGNASLRSWIVAMRSGTPSHPRGELRADLPQGHAAGVHALEHAAARDADVVVAGGLAGLVECGLESARLPFARTVNV